MPKQYSFSHSKAKSAVWTKGLRDIFSYRDLGLKNATNGDYVAHIIKANNRKGSNAVQEWHIHNCNFQFIIVLSGWAEFEYDGHGIHRLEKGDAIHQFPRIRHREISCSDDFEVLEIVSPANFETESSAHS